MKINRQQIKEALFRVIDHIADKGYQRRIWIMGLGPEVDDFDETVCNFVDPADDVIKNFKEYNLTKNQAQVLERFHEIFVAFADKMISLLNSSILLNGSKLLMKLKKY